MTAVVRLRSVSSPAMAALGGAVLLAVALRLPFLAAGIGEDEGGYAYVAREWAHGGHLYGSLWVDRPQGLILAYRALLGLGDHAWVIRLGAVLAGAAVTLLMGVIGWLMRSRATGIAAALTYAVVGVGPHIGGFTFNGELAASVPAAAAVAAALAWLRTRRLGFLVGAGVCGALAVLMKQSGFDGLVVAGAIALAAPAAGIRQRLGRLGLLSAGAAIPLAAAVVHGLVVGWSNYWHAVVAWRVGGEVGVLAHDRPKLFVGSLGQVAPDLLGLACVALAGAVWCLRRRTPRGGAPLWVAPAWLLVAFAGLNVGGLYWEHYYVQLVAPLALLAAIAVTAVRRRAVAAALVTAAIAPVAVTLGGWALASPDERVEVVQFAHHYERDRAVARFIDAHSRPTDTIYALSSQGDLYFLAHRRSAERYLWAHPLREIPGGMDDLRRVLAGPHPPRYVAVFRRPNVVDPTGRLKAILATRYHFRWKGPVDGIRVLEPNGVRPG